MKDGEICIDCMDDQNEQLQNGQIDETPNETTTGEAQKTQVTLITKRERLKRVI